MKYSKNDIVKIFTNWELSEDFIGEAKLLNYVETTPPFSIEDSKYGIINTVYYCGEKWIAEYTNGIFKGITATVTLKAISSIGLNKKNELTYKIDLTTPINDDFRIIPDFDTSFWNLRVDDSETFGHIF